MKKILGFIPFLVFLISGCSFNFEVLTPVPPQTATTEVVQNVGIPVATYPAVSIPPLAGFTPTTSEPVFFGAFVSTDQNSSSGLPTFPAGTKQIFAHWSYQNMREGLIIKREWFLDGQLWIMREEPWDIAKYGESGVMRDVSIYDFEAGLPVGSYRLVVLIGDEAQPIGERIVEGTAQPYIEFEILNPNEAISPDRHWKATTLLDRVVLTDANGSQSDLVTGREIISVTWLDGQHLLFVDRDRSGQVPDLLVGVSDSLWLIDITSRETWPLYKSETALGSTGGLYPSPDGRYIAGIEGTGFGDACFLDAQVIFFEVGDGDGNVKVTKQEQFNGMPVLTDQMLYPTIAGTWKSNTQYSVQLNETCSTDRSLSGFYLFDLAKSDVTFQPVEQTTIAGDLGWGDIHGFVTDAVTGKAIPGATVTCQHSSYTSTSPCTGSVVTNADGVFLFERVFFHDTDTIKITATAPGYQLQEYTQSSFTTNGISINFSLPPLP